MNEAITIKFECHCGGFSAEYEIPRSCVPLKSAVCSCTSCRHSSGQLFTTFAVIPTDATLLTDAKTEFIDGQSEEAWARRQIGQGTLKQHEWRDGFIINFCPTCGARVANFAREEFAFATGMFRGQIDGLLDRQCLFVEDVADDGGGIIWLPENNSAGREIKRHGTDRESAVVNVKSAVAETKTDTLRGSCKCGHVSFYVTRADPSKRYDAELDVCTDCRLVMGWEIQTWTHIPFENVVMDATNDAFDLDTEYPHVTRYKSSANVQRGFCDTCSAAIFYHRRGHIIDLCAGLFWGQGARAEDWFTWSREIAFTDDAIDKAFVSGMAEKIKGV